MKPNRKTPKLDFSGWKDPALLILTEVPGSSEVKMNMNPVKMSMNPVNAAIISRNEKIKLNEMIDDIDRHEFAQFVSITRRILVAMVLICGVCIAFMV